MFKKRKLKLYNELIDSHRYESVDQVLMNELLPLILF